MTNDISLELTEQTKCGVNGTSVSVKLEAFNDKDNQIRYVCKITLGRQTTSTPISITSYDVETTVEQFHYAANTLEKMYKRFMEGDLKKWASLF